MDYYGQAYYGEMSKIRKQGRNRLLCRAIFNLVVMLSLFTSSISLIYLNIINNQLLHTIRQDVNPLVTESTEINQYILRDLQPRVKVMDRVLNYQLPNAILRAFELSHEDLRSTLEGMIIDMKRLTELYKAMLGFEDNWSIDSNAQRLKCTWSSDTIQDEVDAQKNDTLQMIIALNDTLTQIDELESDYNYVTEEIRNLFSRFFSYIRDAPTPTPSATTKSTTIQFDYFIIDTLDSLNYLLYNHVKSLYYCNGDDLKINQTYSDWLNRTRTNYYQYINHSSGRLERLKRNLDKESEKHEANHSNNSSAFYANIDQYKPELIYDSANRKVKRQKRYYIQPSTFRLPTYYYTKDGNPTRKRYKPIEEALDESMKQLNEVENKINQMISDQNRITETFAQGTCFLSYQDNDDRCYCMINKI
ncbi:transmembrane protein [Hipposideros bat paramyxovirus]|nr:transmembrane protein [Hipposideros bat paramyxovirus]